MSDSFHTKVRILDLDAWPSHLGGDDNGLDDAVNELMYEFVDFVVIVFTVFHHRIENLGVEQG